MKYSFLICAKKNSFLIFSKLNLAPRVERICWEDIYIYKIVYYRVLTSFVYKILSTKNIFSLITVGNN